MSDYQLTKIDIAAFRKANTIHVMMNGNGAKVRAIKRSERTERNPFGDTDAEAVIPIPVGCYKGAENPKYSASIDLYRNSGPNPATTIVDLLRVGDDVRFEFYPDAQTNQYMERAELHGDVLRLIVKRGDRKLCFTVVSSVCPENSARMCQNAPARERL